MNIFYYAIAVVVAVLISVLVLSIIGSLKVDPENDPTSDEVRRGSAGPPAKSRRRSDGLGKDEHEEGFIGSFDDGAPPEP